MSEFCDCGACCNKCGHYPDCASVGSPGWEDVAATTAAEDGFPRSRAAIRHPALARTRRHFAASPLPAQANRRWSA